MNNLLRANNIHKTFYQGEERIEVIKGVNIEINAGDQVAMCGPSGAGKSTLLNILGCLDSPSQGVVYFEGENVSLNPPEKLAYLRGYRFGFVFQFHHLLPEFTALENVALPLMIKSGCPMNEEIRLKAFQMLCMVGLKGRSGHLPGELSAGEQQRVAISRALINDPALILADEPTGSLDRATGDAIFSLLLDIQKEKDKAMILVTHNTELAGKCNRQLYLEDGRLKS